MNCEQVKALVHRLIMDKLIRENKPLLKEEIMTKEEICPLWDQGSLIDWPYWVILLTILVGHSKRNNLKNEIWNGA